MAVQVGSFHFPESWFDMRDLGAVLDHEEPLPHPAEDRQHWPLLARGPDFQLSQQATNTQPLELRQQYQNLESEEVEGGGACKQQHCDGSYVSHARRCGDFHS
jgi:hypothetical protein